MLGYVVRRALVALVLIYLVISLVFLMLHLVPGDPAEMLLSGGGISPPPEAVEELRATLQLDLPILEQYGNFLRRLAQGDLGVSFQDGAPVIDGIALRLPRTLALIAAAALISVTLGVPLGTLAALRRGGRADQVLASFASVGLSTPVFVTGTLLVLVFGQLLGWLSVGAFVPFGTAPVRHLGLLLLPAVTISLGLSAALIRMTRSAVLENLGRDWVRTARAKGVPRRSIILHHVVRNALCPVVTVLGLNLGSMLGGTVLVEYVFNWPGLSGFLIAAIVQRDYPVIQGIVLVISCLFVLLNLLIDILYSFLDPRVRLA